MNKNLIHGMMALLFVLIVCISSAAAADDTVTRDLPDSASAGTTITVSLTVDVETSATFYSIDEIVPSGWTVASATDGGDYTSDSGHVKWVVFSGVADKVYSYTVEVPASASGAYTFSGDYAFEGMTDTASILGDTAMNVESGVAADDTVTRDLPDSASAGATITVSLTVDVGTSATFYSIDEIVPSGWTVASATDGGDYTSDSGHVKWVVFSGVADKVYSYTVEVPASASGAHTFSGDYAFEGMTAEASILGDTTVNVGIPDLVINEFMANPSSGSEWVELYNKETTAVDIGGWKVDDIEGGSSPTTIPADTTIAAGGFYLVTLSGAVLNNGGDTVRLLDDAGTLVDSHTYTSSTAGVSEGRTPDGADTWTTFDTPTPDASNVAANQPPTAVIAAPTADGTYHEGEEVSFLSTGSADTDGTIVSYNWDFGDGITDTVANPTHTYATTGSMTVTLTVTDDDGATDTANVTIVLESEVSVTLYEGWNLIAVPVHDTTADTAAELASKITGCKEVVKYDAVTDAYVAYTKIDPDWTGTDFDITGGMGLFVNVESDTTVSFTGNAWS